METKNHAISAYKKTLKRLKYKQKKNLLQNKHNGSKIAHKELKTKSMIKSYLKDNKIY